MGHRDQKYTESNDGVTRGEKIAEKPVRDKVDATIQKSPGQEERAQTHHNRNQRQSRKQATKRQRKRKQTKQRRQTETVKKGGEKRRSNETREQKTQPKTSPTSRRDLVTDQARATADRPGGGSQDCARIFLVKGAAEASVSREISGKAAGSA